MSEVEDPMATSGNLASKSSKLTGKGKAMIGNLRTKIAQRRQSSRNEMKFGDLSGDETSLKRDTSPGNSVTAGSPIKVGTPDTPEPINYGDPELENMQINLNKYMEDMSSLRNRVARYGEAYQQQDKVDDKVCCSLNNLFAHTMLWESSLRATATMQDMAVQRQELLSNLVMTVDSVVNSEMVKVDALLKRTEILRPLRREHKKAQDKCNRYLNLTDEQREQRGPKIVEAQKWLACAKKDYEDAREAILIEGTQAYRYREETLKPIVQDFMNYHLHYHVAAAAFLEPQVNDLLNTMVQTSDSKALRIAAWQWLTASTANSRLRYDSRYKLTTGDYDRLLCVRDFEEMSETEVRAFHDKVENDLRLYSETFKSLGANRDDLPSFQIPTIFDRNPVSARLALKACCSTVELENALTYLTLTDVEQKMQMEKDLTRATLRIGGTLYPPCNAGEDSEENLENKRKAIHHLILDKVPRMVLKTAEDRCIDALVERIMIESMDTYSRTAAKTAVQLLYGKPFLVIVKAAVVGTRDTPPTVVDIETRDDGNCLESFVQVKMSSRWCMIEDHVTFAMLQREIDAEVMGAADASYIAEIPIEQFLQAEANEHVDSTDRHRYVIPEVSVNAVTSRYDSLCSLGDPSLPPIESADRENSEGDHGLASGWK
eukprot:Clim_evm27s206 gene=Clim_evmTU27s206